MGRALSYGLIAIVCPGFSALAQEGSPSPTKVTFEKDVRPILKLRSTAGTGYTYVTRKNRRNNPDRIVLKKYDPVVRKHVDFREER